jgi:hypothetical protein
MNMVKVILQIPTDDVYHLNPSNAKRLPSSKMYADVRSVYPQVRSYRQASCDIHSLCCLF